MALENIRQWEGSEAVDPDHARIGRIQDVYFDADTDEPLFVTVHSGLLGRHLAFVPTAGAALAQGYLQVARTRAQVRGAPQIKPGGELSPDQERRVFDYYGMEYPPASTESGRRLVRH